MKILIATHNLDKYKILISMLSKYNNTFKFYNLNDLRISKKIIEKGTIEERSFQKARFFFNIIKEKANEVSIDCVIGVDDGISLSEFEVGNPNSKELTDKILSNELVETGEVVWIKRSFTVIKRDNQVKSYLTSIPFIFLGNKDSVMRREGKYPLSYVFGIIEENKNRPLMSLSHKDRIKYYLKYSDIDIKELVNFIIK